MKTEPIDPAKQLAGFIGKFAPKHQALIRSVRRALRRRFPTAYELVYDNYNFFVIGYGTTERPSDCIISIVAAANGIGLCFIHGATLADPKKILLGSGKQTRFLRIATAAALAQPEVADLLVKAALQARKPFPRTGRGQLIIRSVSKKQRPRRKP
jgi:hypothetical protein